MNLDVLLNWVVMRDFFKSFVIVLISLLLVMIMLLGFSVFKLCCSVCVCFICGWISIMNNFVVKSIMIINWSIIFVIVVLIMIFLCFVNVLK